MKYSQKDVPKRLYRIVNYLFGINLYYGKWFGLFLYNTDFIIKFIVIWLKNFFICGPLFKARCKTIGKNLRLWGRLPWISGVVEIDVGDNLEIFDKISIVSSLSGPSPKLLIGNNVSIGGGVTFYLSKSIKIGDRVMIGNNCCFYDNDSHPIKMAERQAGEKVSKDNIKPVIIEDDVWIGFNSIVLKGVTIGRGSIVSAGSVVRRSIPPNTIVAGNPARPTLKIEE